MVKKSLFWIYRATLIALWTIIILFAVAVLALRYWLLPHVDQYRDTIARHASLALGQKITIGDLHASWDGLNPHLSLHQVDVYDNQNRSALSLTHIEASISWLSAPLLEPRLSSLTIDKPELTVRRVEDGSLYVAGIHMGGPARPAFANWLLRQAQIDVVDASVLWQDDMRKAPPLALNQLNLQIVSPPWESIVGHHRFGLRATPSAGSSRPIDVRGNLYGKNVANLDNWHGTLYGHLEGTDIAAWRNWLSYPFDMREGFGAAQFWLDFDHGQLTKLTSDVMLSNVVTRLTKRSQEATLDNLSGRLRWQLLDNGQEISAEHIKIASPNGLNLQNGTLFIRQQTAAGKEVYEGRLQLDELQLESVNTFASYLPIPKQNLQQLAEINPVGKLANLELSWKGDEDQLSDYLLRTRFSGLGMQPYQHIPGFSNLSGSIDADQSHGSVSMNSTLAMLDVKDTMRLPIPLDKLSGEVAWQNSKGTTEITVNNLAVANPHLAGVINGSYLMDSNAGDAINLTGRFDHADAKFAHFYYPSIMGEHTLHWLDTSILAGNVDDINVIVKGKVSDFPYINPKLGLFKVTAKVSDGELEFGSEWPKIAGIKLDMLFQGSRMELNASAGSTLGTQITRGKIVIPELHTTNPVLLVDADGQGLVSDGIQYLINSPLHKITSGFTDGLRATGNGKLYINLTIPLENADSTKVNGSYLISNASMARDGAPELTRINGKLSFTETLLGAQNINAWIYGGPAVANIATGKDKVLRIAARGRITDVGLKQAFGAGIADQLSGDADWLADLSIQQQQLEVSIRSTLVGMASNLPAPLSKTASDKMPLRIDQKALTPQQTMTNIAIANAVSIKLLNTQQTNGQWLLDRGDIGLNALSEMPGQRGLSVHGTMEKLDMDEWHNLMDKTSASNPGITPTALTLNKVDLNVNQLDVFERRINALKLTGKAANNGWQLNLQSHEITGDVQWLNQGAGKITAKLKSLIVPSSTPDTAQLRTQGNFKQQAQHYPALDVVADNFEFGAKKLGRLELQASQQNDDWSIEKLKISNPDSVLFAEGEWHNWKLNPNTRMNISWDISDIGKTLERFGYPGTIKAGEGNLSGQLKWLGSPHEFDVTNLGGNVQLDVRHGQILKIKPGVGRVFSVLSLQNLPRRFTFDFRDVFSSGFAFDKIDTSMKIDRGMMHFDDFMMEGPTARVAINGDLDLQKETQHLFVKVTPYVSDSLSLAAFAGGPVVGAAAYLAQKLLKDPINKFAANDYEIIGSWDNPQEVKIGNAGVPKTPDTSPAPALSTPALPVNP